MYSSLRRACGVGFVLILAVVPVPGGQVNAGVLERLFAPRAKLWHTWVRHEPDSVLSIDHRSWDAFLDAYVVPGADGVNRVAYARVTDADLDDLKTYLETLESVNISSHTRKQQFAYWVNLYNALTVYIVLQHYPVDSIRDIKLTKGLFARGPWAAKVLTIEGERISLNDIEHRILRPIWQDSRIHYAVNCASVGCPNLAPRAFTANNLERLLDGAARDYVNHPRGAEVREGRLYVSSIYEWFRDDFGGSAADIIEHLRRYAGHSLAADLQGIRRISGDRYDWKLNDTAN